MTDKDFGGVEIFTGLDVETQGPENSALVNIEQSRAVAEVQASIVLAKANPRSEQASYNAIMTACKRHSLAACATYAYRRGGTLVTGPSIRLAEVLARLWGNIQYGFREIGRGKDYSEVESFAHDLETNTRVIRQFQVKHWRDKKGGGQLLETERDKYEMVASMAQRRVRSCLLELIPGDIIDAAEEACKATLMKSIRDIDKTIEDTIKAFAEFSVTKDMLEAYLQRDLKSAVPADIVNLKRIYRSIRDGVASPGDFFGQSDGAVVNKDTGEIKKEDNQKSTPKQARTRPAVIQGFKDEIKALDSSYKLDLWRQKHIGRIERELPKEGDRQEVHAYADARYRALKAKENEAKVKQGNTNADSKLEINI